MKLVLQIVSDAELSVDKKTISKIDTGLVTYFCVEKDDKEEDLYYFAKRISELRIFPDDKGKANLSIKDVDGEILLISQFTLAGDFHHKLRPDFSKAEVYEKAKEMYMKLYEILTKEYKLKVKIGVFGADMIVKQTGVGPFTAYIEK
jgi:D-tyrosyl-tRNA(Tyr) deacylase